MPGHPDPGQPFDREHLQALFSELAEELRRRDARAHVYIAGGAAMAMAWGRERTTQDVDARIDSAHDAMTASVRAVAKRHGLPSTWLNEQATTYFPAAPDRRAPVVFDSPWLVITGASAEHLLAMKLEAARSGDIDDIRTLLGVLEIRTPGPAVEVHAALFPESNRLAEVREVLKAVLARGDVSPRQPALRRDATPTGLR